ncbi:unnamed protein product [Ambrosiozyma monospora]|uniref:Glycosylphosphatidylinositol anchor biosynthesis protein 11 n=1 Tax=Ambrosiozyma monospora TaxID=43982 RepID=A0A9W6YQT5_AMBMO|nr:unnamed protein product [Ambrosiozyma monospora]
MSKSAAAQKKKVSFTKEVTPEVDSKSSKTNKSTTSSQQAQSSTLSPVTSPSSISSSSKKGASFLLIPFHYILLVVSLFKYYDILANVDQALLNSLVGLIALQTVYGLLITMATGSAKPSTVSGSQKKKTKRIPNSKKSASTPTGIDILLIILLVAISLGLSIPLFTILVLFGAPISPEYNIKNLYLSAHISLLTLFPFLVYYRAKLLKDFKLLFSAMNQLNQMTIITFGGLCGCWFGVLPIPLDWDRDWQAWPITLLVGTYIGAFVGGVVGYVYDRFF